MPQTFDGTRTTKGRHFGKPLTAGVETLQQKWTLQSSFAFKLPSSVFQKISPIIAVRRTRSFLKVPSGFQRFLMISKAEESNDRINTVTNREFCRSPAAFRFPFLSDGSAGLDDPARENWHHYSHKIARLSLEGVGIALARCDFSLIFAAKNLPIWKGGEVTMDLLKRLYVEEDGQGLVEYTLIVVLVALVFWVAIKNTNVGNQLASGWSKVTSCVGDPSACDVSS